MANGSLHMSSYSVSDPICSDIAWTSHGLMSSMILTIIKETQSACSNTVLLLLQTVQDGGPQARLFRARCLYVAGLSGHPVLQLPGRMAL